MLKRVLFKVEHLEVMDVRQIELDDLLALDTVRYFLKQMSGRIDAVTWVHKGRIIACAGFFCPLPGTAEVWLIPSVYVKEVPILFVREVRSYLEVLAETFKWNRIQTVTRVDNFHRKWMKVLGFEEEGVMKKYRDGQDYIISARYFNWS